MARNLSKLRNKHSDSQSLAAQDVSGEKVQNCTIWNVFVYVLVLTFIQYPKQSGNCVKNSPYARCESSGDPTDSTCVQSVSKGRRKTKRGLVQMQNMYWYVLQQ